MLAYLRIVEQNLQANNTVHNCNSSKNRCHIHQNELVLRAQGKNVMQINAAAVYHVSLLVIIIIIRHYCNDKHVEQIRVFKWPANHIWILWYFSCFTEHTIMQGFLWVLFSCKYRELLTVLFFMYNIPILNFGHCKQYACRDGIFFCH